eukprot:TRINITY_DN3039_c0_g1_i6.p1 TRINITY_DN3039_c0_g1~~TRINITY_DN3039_c0_g1_i6.p1  ORF type:complete len:1951 (+),score=262.10 TRINITY_DN3039_c0_g1_i6:80-5932(+)
MDSNSPSVAHVEHTSMQSGLHSGRLPRQPVVHRLGQIPKILYTSSSVDLGHEVIESRPEQLHTSEDYIGYVSKVPQKFLKSVQYILDNFSSDCDPWKMTMSPKRDFLVILRINSIRIVDIKDLEKVYVLFPLTTDPYPALRKVTISPCSFYIAIGFSNGSICILDRNGNNQIRLSKVNGGLKPFAGLFWLPTRDLDPGERRLVSVSFHGKIALYKFVPAAGRSPPIFQKIASLSVTKYHLIVTSADLSQDGSKLLVSGGFVDVCWEPAISLWDLINFDPYAILLRYHGPKLHPKTWVATLAESIFLSFTTIQNEPKIIKKASISPCGNYFVTLNFEGTVQISTLETLETKNHLNLDQFRQLMGEPITETNTSNYKVEDVYWWTPGILNVVINQRIYFLDLSQDVPSFVGDVADVGGKLSLTPACGDGFYVLQNKDFDPTRRRPIFVVVSDEVELFDFPTRIANSIWNVFMGIFYQKALAPYVNEDAGAHHLISIDHILPEDHFRNLISQAKYDAALDIAREFGFSSDPVYKKKWESSEISIETIQEYLNNVSDKRWVLEQCINKNAPTKEIMINLLEYGISLSIALTEGSAPFTRLSLKKYQERLQEDRYRLETLCSFSDYKPREFSLCRMNNIVDVAKYYAFHENYTALSALLSYHQNEILPQWLDLLSHIPETAYPAEYRTLLPSLTADGIVQTPPSAHWPGFPSRTSSGVPFTRDQLAAWYVNRAGIIDERSGQLGHSLQLLQIAVENNLPETEDALEMCTYLFTSLYDSNVDITFKKFNESTTFGKLELLLQKSTPETIAKDIIKYAGFCFKPNHVGDFLAYFKHQAANGRLDKCHAIITMTKPDYHDSIRIPLSDIHVLRFGVDCCYAYPKVDGWDYMTLIYACLPEIDPEETNEIYLSLHGEADQLERDISAAKVLHESKYPVSLSELRSLASNQEASKTLLRKFVRQTVLNTAATDQQLYQLFDTLLHLHSTSFSSVDKLFLQETYVEGLLLANKFKIAQIFMSERTRAGHPLDEKLVLRIAVEHIGSAAHSSDRSMGVAKECLSLLPSSPEVQRHRDIISAVQLLEKFGCNFLPLEIMQKENKLEFVREALRSKTCPGSYLEYDQIMRLGYCLGLVSDLDQDSILLEIAHAAYSHADYDQARDHLTVLASRNYQPAWKLCLSLGRCHHFDAFKDRAALLEFAICFCEVDDIPPLLEMIETLLCLSAVTIKALKQQSEEDDHGNSPEDVQFSQLMEWVQSGPGSHYDLLRGRRLDEFPTLSPVYSHGEAVRPSRGSTSLNTIVQPNSPLRTESTISIDSSHRLYLALNSNIDLTTRLIGLCASQSLQIPRAVAHIFLTHLMEVDYTVFCAFASRLIQTHGAQDAILLYDHAIEKVESSLESMQSLMKSSCYIAALSSVLSNFLAVGPKDLPPTSSMEGLSKQSSGTATRAQEFDILLMNPSNLYRLYSSDFHTRNESMLKYERILQDMSNMHSSGLKPEYFDFTKYAKNEGYRKETALRLARSSSIDDLNRAIIMGRSNGIPEFEVYCEHIKWMFSTGVRYQDIASFVETIQELLADHKAQFGRAAQDRIYPIVPGTAHDSFLGFFELSAKFTKDYPSLCKDLTGHHLGFEELDFLKRLASALPLLDLRAFLSTGMEVMQEQISIENIHEVANLFESDLRFPIRVDIARLTSRVLLDHMKLQRSLPPPSPTAPYKHISTTDLVALWDTTRIEKIPTATRVQLLEFYCQASSQKELCNSDMQPTSDPSTFAGANDSSDVQSYQRIMLVGDILRLFVTSASELSDEALLYCEESILNDSQAAFQETMCKCASVGAPVSTISSALELWNNPSAKYPTIPTSPQRYITIQQVYTKALDDMISSASDSSNIDICESLERFLSSAASLSESKTVDCSNIISFRYSTIFSSVIDSYELNTQAFLVSHASARWVYLSLRILIYFPIQIRSK